MHTQAVPTNNNQVLAPPMLRAPEKQLPIALVCMPWGSVQKPSLAMAILKQCARAAGFRPELHFLNIRFAEILGLERYEALVELPFISEWFFSPALFGDQGLGEIRNSWTDLKAHPDAGKLIQQLCASTGSEEFCRDIATECVPRFIDECLARTDWGRYLAVGFTTTFAQSLSSLLLAKRIKEKHSNVKIIFGGANVDSEMGVEMMKACDWIDYVVHGEAENTFPALLSDLAAGTQGEDIPGVSRRQGQTILPGHSAAGPVVDLNQSPAPDYSDYVNELERTGFKKQFNLRLYFESSRGCWWGAKHHCTFCGLNGSTMAFRKKDAERVYEEILELSRAYGCLSFSATDNILAIEYFSQLLPKLASLGTDIQFFYEIKANVTREQIKLLSAAGVKELQPGIESLNSHILKLMRKGITAIQNIQFLKWCYESGVDPYWNILYGFPGELPEDYRDYPELCRVLSHLPPPTGIIRVIFERFSPYFFDKAKFGLELKAAREYKFIFPESRVELDKLAYFFDGRWHDQAADPEDYAKPTIDAGRSWIRKWNEKSTYCYYCKGPDYIVIHDNRARTADAPQKYRRIHLNQKVSAIYLFCDENRSFHAICEMLSKRFTEVTPEKIQGWLDQLVEQGLMFREGERYLSLAVHRKPDRQAKLARIPGPTSNALPA